MTAGWTPNIFVIGNNMAEICMYCSEPVLSNFLKIIFILFVLQKYQRIAEQSKDKISVYKKTKDQMALENVRIKNLLINTEKDHKSLLAACALLAGALYPLYSRACTLATQRNSLQDQMNTYVDIQSEIRNLVQALSDSEVKRNEDSKRSPKCSRCMKHVFRRGVIVVLAANRLQRLGRSSRTLFMWMEGLKKGPGLLVCPGGAKSNKTLSKAIPLFTIH